MLFTDVTLAYVLVPLLALFALAFAWVLVADARGRLRTGGALAFPSLGPLLGARTPLAARVRRGIQGLRVVTLALLGFAMLRPQDTASAPPSHQDGIDIILAVDTSGSMGALDLDDGPIIARKSRLDVVKEVIQTFSSRRKDDQLGLVVFGAEAFLQCPLTLDHELFGGLVDEVTLGMAGDATAIGSGLGVAVKRLQKSKAKSKVVILLTDGVNNAGVLSPKKAAEIAKTFGIKVYTIGAGSSGKAPRIASHPLFGDRVVYDEVRIDEETLKAVAQTTGGLYFRAEDKGGLLAIYERIDAMEKTPHARRQKDEYKDLFGWFVLPALALLMLEVVLLGTRFAKVP